MSIVVIISFILFLVILRGGLDIDHDEYGEEWL